MVPRDFSNERPCNLTLQRQMVDGAALESTSEYWSALKDTPWTADRPRKIFFRAGRHLVSDLLGWSRPVQCADRHVGLPGPPRTWTLADGSGQSRIAAYNSSLQPTTTYS